MSSKNTLPNPPMLKTTIIQLNKELDSSGNNYEILTNEYANGGKPKAAESNFIPVETKRRRRRSSNNVASEEIIQRKNATKQLHSIIEKRRRIKINREFEALKYLIPACRTINSSSNSKKENGNSGSKLDGIYKLTILKSSVEYILYLHHIINAQNKMLSEAKCDGYNFNAGFTQTNLDVNKYRNIDIDYDFNNLLNNSQGSTNTESLTTEISDPSSISPKDINRQENQLLSPDATPNIGPLYSVLSKNAEIQKQASASMLESDRSEIEYPIRSSGQKDRKDKPRFQLPDSAIEVHSVDTIPRPGFSIGSDTDEINSGIPEHVASTTLLSLRKSSIHNLLN